MSDASGKLYSVIYPCWCLYGPHLPN